MIRTLKKKFIFTSMLAVTVLLVVLLSVINIFNIFTVSRETESKLSIITSSENENSSHKSSSSDNTVPPEDPPGRTSTPGKTKDDILMSSSFFVVRINADKEILSTDISRTPSISAETAEAMAEKVLTSGQTSGKYSCFLYKLADSDSTDGNALVFLDISGELHSCLRVLLFSVIGGLFCWICMLLLVMLLARKAIHPIAETIEKQKQFITDAGHEIKTPLAIIQSNTEAMELFNGENKWSKNIKEQTARLSGLMQNLLFLARMEEAPDSSYKETLFLDQLTRESVDSFLQPLEMKQVQITTAIDSPVRWIGNRQYFIQLLSILLDNVRKYTNEGGTVFLSLMEHSSDIVLLVENSCISVPDAEPKRLFDRFYRSDKARLHKDGGYGIGLAAARSITTGCGGSIQAEYLSSTKIRFTVQLPKDTTSQK